jgi:hypothetical protein
MRNPSTNTTQTQTAKVSREGLKSVCLDVSNDSLVRRIEFLHRRCCGAIDDSGHFEPEFVTEEPECFADVTSEYVPPAGATENECRMDSW